MPFWIYMLLVGDQSHGTNRKIYTGYTHHLMTRIAQHSGLTPTKGARLTRRQSIELVYLEQYKSRKKALQREWQLKHESPFNQKKHKLKLIEDFDSKFGHILLELNKKLVEHFEFLTTIIKTMKSVEKRIAGEMKNTPV